MKTMMNLRVRLEHHTMLKELAEKTGISIGTLAELAIKRIVKVDVSELTKVQKEKDAAYERALQRLSDEISPVIPVVPKKDSYDKMIDKTFQPKQDEPDEIKELDLDDILEV